MAMNFFFNVKGDPANWNPGTIFFYNGSINEIQGVHNTEELKYVGEVYRETTGLELKMYWWTNMAPVYVRVFGTLQPTSRTEQIKNALDRIYDQLSKAVD